MHINLPDENGVNKEIDVSTIAENLDQFVTADNKPLVVELIKLIADMEDDRLRMQRTGDDLNGKIRHLEMTNRHYMTTLADFHQRVAVIKDIDTNPELASLQKFANETLGIRSSLSVLDLSGTPTKKRMLQIMHGVFTAAKEGKLSAISIIGLSKFVAQENNHWLLDNAKEAYDEQ